MFLFLTYDEHNVCDINGTIVVSVGIILIEVARILAHQVLRDSGDVLCVNHSVFEGIARKYGGLLENFRLTSFNKSTVGIGDGLISLSYLYLYRGRFRCFESVNVWNDDKVTYRYILKFVVTVCPSDRRNMSCRRHHV